MSPAPRNHANILLIEDNPGDVRLIRETFSDKTVLHNLHVAKDGMEALAFLRRDGTYAGSPRPDLILLDLHLPKKDGHEVLAEIKADRKLKLIPVLMLTTSQADEDIFKAYSLNANCYVTKPVDVEDFMAVIRSIEHFWLNAVKLPSNS